MEMILVKIKKVGKQKTCDSCGYRFKVGEKVLMDEFGLVHVECQERFERHLASPIGEPDGCYINEYGERE